MLCGGGGDTEEGVDNPEQRTPQLDFVFCYMISDTDMKLHMMDRGFTSWEVVHLGQLIP